MVVRYVISVQWCNYAGANMGALGASWHPYLKNVGINEERDGGRKEGNDLGKEGKGGSKAGTIEKELKIGAQVDKRGGREGWKGRERGEGRGKGRERTWETFFHKIIYNSQKLPTGIYGGDVNAGLVASTSIPIHHQLTRHRR